MPSEKRADKYPNGLRAAREARGYTRYQLSELSRRLADEDSLLYTLVGEETIKSLEAGWSRPRPKTMMTLAKVLGKSVKALFPAGADNGVRRQASS